MPSKTSKPSPKSRPTRPSLTWKVASDCSEVELSVIAKSLALELKRGDRVLMEGPMGAGKTTFARVLLLALGVVQPAEGSPTFAIAHEYAAPRSEVVHLDFYRLKSEAEITEAGIEAYFWERSGIVISEWTSLFPEFEQSVLKSNPTAGGRNFRVELGFGSEPTTRQLKITVL